MRSLVTQWSASTGGTASSDWFQIANMAKLSALVVTANDNTAGGTVTLEVSNESTNGGGSMMPFTPTTYATVSGFTQTITGNGTGLVAPFDVAYQWARFVWTRSAGSGGTVTVYLSGHD